MAYELPAFYDSINQVVRPMDMGDQIPPPQIPISAHSGNQLLLLADGLYLGNPVSLPSVVYINAVTGADTVGNGAIGAPYRSIDFAMAQLVSESVGNQLQTSVVVALQAGQTFNISFDINLYGGTLEFTFYGDPNYGSGYNSVPVGSGANPWFMTDLARPTIAPQVSLINEYWHMAGVNVYGGNVSLVGVELLLPVAPAQPAIALYSSAADFIRPVAYTLTGYLDIRGTIVNMQDVTAFWGLLGLSPRSTFTLVQYGSQFQVNAKLMDAANSPTANQLAARQYFIKFYPDAVGNNQQQLILYDTAATATPAAGLLTVLWADTESFVVEGLKTNLLTFPIAYDLVYGLRNYMYGLKYDGINRPINVNSSREI